MIVSLKAKVLLENDLVEYLAPTHLLPSYWGELTKDYLKQEVAGKEYKSIPIQLHGDEGQVHFKGHMVLSWQPELSPYKTNSMLSRFLVCVVPEQMYYYSKDKANCSKMSNIFHFCSSFVHLAGGEHDTTRALAVHNRRLEQPCARGCWKQWNGG